MLRGNWQDFNWHDASRGPSAIAELLVLELAVVPWYTYRARYSHILRNSRFYCSQEKTSMRDSVSGVDPGGGAKGAIAPPPNKNIPGREYLFAPSKFLLNCKETAPRMHHKSPFWDPKSKKISGEGAMGTPPPNPPRRHDRPPKIYLHWRRCNQPTSCTLIR